MNKRDREQLRTSIAKDLVQGQGEHSPTKELLRQYAPLEGVVTTPAKGKGTRLFGVRRNGTDLAKAVSGHLCPFAKNTTPSRPTSPIENASRAFRVPVMPQ